MLSAISRTLYPLSGLFLNRPGRGPKKNTGSDLHGREKGKKEFFKIISVFPELMTIAQGYLFPHTLPKVNVWVTLANITGQDTLCLATASPNNPFSTCFVGLPLDKWPIPESVKHAFPALSPNLMNEWDAWVSFLPQATLEPQEIELLGSVKMDFCVKFNYTGKNQSKAWDVSPAHPIFKNASAWCNYTATNLSKSSNTPVFVTVGDILYLWGQSVACYSFSYKGRSM